MSDIVNMTEEMRTVKKNALKENGVVFIDEKNCYISENVQVGSGTIIYPGTILEGNTKIGANCVVGPNSHLTDMEIGEGVHIQYTVAAESTIGDGTTVGPFAYIRPHTVAGKNCRLGDFVELKNVTIGDKTKVSHLTYLGDADIGSGVNFGCGTVMVNYDGKKKFRSKVGHNAFIGCNTNLVSPVTIGDGAYTAAGSTITHDVPENSLGIARERQVVKEGWQKK